MNKTQQTSNETLPLPKQREIWLVEFPPTKEDRKPIRPCLVISDNIQNEYGRWIVIIAMTTEDIETIEPFEVFIEKTSETGIDYPSKLQFNYPRTIDRERLKERLGVANKEVMKKAKKAWIIAFDTDIW